MKSTLIETLLGVSASALALVAQPAAAQASDPATRIQSVVGPENCTISGEGHVIQGMELSRILKRILARPDIRTEKGFAAHPLSPPGEMYDPLFMRDRGDVVWVNDCGGQEGNAGGQIVAVDRRGRVATVVGLGRLLPVTGFDIAPASFGSYGGQIFSLTQPEVGRPGLTKNHVIQRVDPTKDEKASIFCRLPSVGTQSMSNAAPGTPGYGIDALFGPAGTQFAGRFFAITTMNGTIYQVTPDGRCTPFVTFDREKWGSPQGMIFSQDGRHMFVATNNEERGVIAKVRPDGTIEPEPLLRAPDLWLTGMAYAPRDFGDYGGQLFIAAQRAGKEYVEAVKAGKLREELTRPPREIGVVHRLTPKGEFKLVASGFRNPQGVHFVGNRMWVSDLNGDFIAENRELPDGFIVEITAPPTP
jgi:hypothetical protein